MARASSPYWDHTGQEFHHLDRIVPLCIKEIQPILLLIDIRRIPTIINT